MIKRLAPISILAIASVLPMLAVDGIVLNGTTRQPQPGAAITLIQPGANGMQELGKATSGPDGKFSIDRTIPPGPGLLQTVYQGVTYNQIITPGMPTSGVEVMVYEATRSAAAAQVGQHLILIEPGVDELRVNDTFIFINETNSTYSDPERGSARFYIPPGSVDSARITVTAPGGMPITRPPVKTNDKDFYKVDYPVKPGQTRFDLAYAAPAAASFAGKIVGADGSAHLVTASSVKLTGDDIELTGIEPQTQANIYTIKGQSYAVKIEGTGGLRTSSGGPEQDAGEGEDTGQPKIEFASARIYSRVGWVLGLSLGILLLGGMILYRRGAA